MHAESGLQRREFEEAIERLLRLCIAFELDDDAHAALVGFVAQVADLFQLAAADEFSDAFQQARFVELVGDLADDDAEAPAAQLFNFGLGADDDLAAPGGIRLYDGFAAHDNAARGKIWPLDEAHQLFHADFFLPIPVVEQMDERRVDFTQVVWGNIRCHAHGDAR